MGVTASEHPGGVLAELWSRMRHVAVERVDLILGTLGALTDGDAGDDDVELAVSAAHKLVGALGMYGFPEGSRIARRAEAVLLADDPERSRLDEVAAELLALRSTLHDGPTP